MAPSAQSLARALLDAARRDERSDALLAELAELHVDALAHELESDAERTVFWMHLYNAFAQRLIGALSSERVGLGVFVRRAAVVAGAGLNLNDIENGMLRGSRPLVGLGYLKNPFAGSFERRMRVRTPDARVHFALNCGAASCPAIRYYDPATLDAALGQATRTYLEAEVERAGDTIRVPALFRFYAGDFGGTAGTYAMLEAHGLLTGGARPRLEWKPWDWTRKLGHFAASDTAGGPRPT